ncbi:MAG: hypothetical protein P1U77_07630 [Rubripirellula sp.]|nr:hypothetical protein [Rubripirellula sp.]
MDLRLVRSQMLFDMAKFEKFAVSRVARGVFSTRGKLVAADRSVRQQNSQDANRYNLLVDAG